MKTFGEKLLRSTSPSDHEWNVMSTHSAGYVLKYSILFIAFRKKKNHPELGKKAWENLFISMAKMGSSPVNQV